MELRSPHTFDQENHRWTRGTTLVSCHRDGSSPWPRDWILSAIAVSNTMCPFLCSITHCQITGHYTHLSGLEQDLFI